MSQAPQYFGYSKTHATRDGSFALMSICSVIVPDFSMSRTGAMQRSLKIDVHHVRDRRYSSSLKVDA